MKINYSRLIGDADFEAGRRLLRSCAASLQSLDMVGAKLAQFDRASLLCNGVLASMRSLRKLRIDGLTPGIHHTKDEIFMLSRALGGLPCLVELAIGSCGAEDAKAVENSHAFNVQTWKALSRCSSLERLTVKNLSSLLYASQHAPSLPARLQHVDLSGNMAAGVKAFSVVALRSKAQLKTLDVSFCGIDSRDSSWLAACIRALPSLTAFDVSYNDMLGLEGATEIALALAFAAPGENIRQLNMRNTCNFQLPAARDTDISELNIRFAKALGQLSGLLDLNLHENWLINTPDFEEALSSAPLSSSLTKLELGSLELGSLGLGSLELGSLGLALHGPLRFPKLRHLNLHGIMWHPEGWSTCMVHLSIRMELARVALYMLIALLRSLKAHLAPALEVLEVPGVVPDGSWAAAVTPQELTKVVSELGGRNFRLLDLSRNRLLPDHKDHLEAIDMALMPRGLVRKEVGCIWTFLDISDA